MENCPNCGASLKSGVWSSNKLCSVGTVAFIDEYREDKKGAYCTKCAPKETKATLPVYEKEVKDLQAAIMDMVNAIPAVSTHSPQDWDYKTIGVVTGQSTMGAGLLTEIGSGISDLFGLQNNGFSNKLKTGEDACMLQIKKKAVERGANAIVALDIDYNEMGKANLIMVCMTGTAIVLHGENNISLAAINEKRTRLSAIISMKNNVLDSEVGLVQGVAEFQ